MPFAIRVKENDDLNTPWRFEKVFANVQEFAAVNRLCIDRERHSDWTAAWGAVRTDTCNHFVNDFFFPLTIGALKIKDLALKIFMIIGGFVWDLITFPVRLIKLIPRYFENQTNTKAHHPLHKYLAQEGTDIRVLNSDYIWLQRETPGHRYSQFLNYIERDWSEPPSVRYLWQWD